MIDFSIFYKKENRMRYWKWIIRLVPIYIAVHIIYKMWDVISYHPQLSIEWEYLSWWQFSWRSVLFPLLPDLPTTIFFFIMPFALISAIFAVEAYDYYFKSQ